MEVGNDDDDDDDDDDGDDDDDDDDDDDGDDDEETVVMIILILIRYSLFYQLRHIICIMFNYVFMQCTVLCCIVLHCCIVLSKPMDTKFLCFIMDQ